MRQRAGFTLMEVLMAIAVTGILLTYATFFMVSIHTLYLDAQRDPAYKVHARNVSYFMEHLFREASIVKTSTPTPNTGTVSWSRLPGAAPTDDPLLSFHMTRTNPLLLDGVRPVQGVDVWIDFDDQGNGLYFLWRSKTDAIEEPRLVRRSLISPYVTNVEYAYYDAEEDSWEDEDSFLDDQKGKLPNLLQIHFEYPNEVKQTIRVNIPPTTAGVPVY